MQQHIISSKGMPKIIPGTMKITQVLFWKCYLLNDFSRNFNHNANLVRGFFNENIHQNFRITIVVLFNAKHSVVQKRQKLLVEYSGR